MFDFHLLLKKKNFFLSSFWRKSLGGRHLENKLEYICTYVYCWMLIFKIEHYAHIVAEDRAALYYCRAHSTHFCYCKVTTAWPAIFISKKKKFWGCFFTLKIRALTWYLVPPKALQCLLPFDDLTAISTPVTYLYN